MKEAPLTYLDIMVDWKIGRDKLEKAVFDLQLEVSMGTPHSNLTRTISPESQVQISDYLKIIHPSKVGEFLESGYVPSNVIHEFLGISKGGAMRFLRKLYPDWKEQFYTFPSGQRRIHLLPPDVVANIKCFSDLEPERQQLSLWRAWRKRGIPFVENYGNALVASRILAARDLIDLDDDDMIMLESLVYAEEKTVHQANNFVAANLHIIQLSIAKNSNSTKSFEEAQKFALEFTLKLFVSESYVSEDRLNARFANAIWEFVNS